MSCVQEVLIIKYGEIALRGKNRHIYENMLLDSIRKNLAQAQCGDFYVRKEQGRFVVEWNGEVEFARIMPHITCIFGITSACIGIKLADQSMEAIQAAALAYARQHCPTPATFKVDTRRANKQYPLRSDEISAQVGGFLLDNMEGLKVNLSAPDFTLKIEIRSFAYIYSPKSEVKGPGGLPPGSAGKGVLLLSGGIDSPVAGYLAAKRGIDLVAAYFHSPPYTSERAKEKVIDLARRLSHFTGKIRLIVIPFTDIQLKLVERTPPEKITILLKRAMLRISGQIAQQEKALALITGDSVGQVASQTLHSLYAMTGATEMPIIRPLACFDKHEIVTIAQNIDTFPISIRPYDDCCTLFLPKHPETKPKLSIIQSVEGNVDNLGELIEQAIADAEVIEF
ncbi:MAG: tRNA 4-thiouridine(8) synthase ThiI [Defluviitaleaceae bacterium]|nr:tRNA 4-thiouridine(8) synthase ThiI [Defluviitaleaceae bacterium]